MIIDMKVMCAIDGSRHSVWAMEWAARLCEPRKSSLLLVHAVDMAPFTPLPTLDRKERASLVKVLETSLEGAARLLESAEKKAMTAWGSVKARLLRGSPAEAISRAAQREGVDLLAVGSRGMSEFQPMLIGSVSRKLLMRAPCPVLVVKRPLRTLGRVVLGTDGSRESWDALSLLRQFPAGFRREVLVVAVVPPLPLSGSQEQTSAASPARRVRRMLESEARALVSRAAGTLKHAGFSAEEHVAFGHPAAEIVNAVSSNRAGLAVVGSRSGRNRTEYLLGSVADAVVKHASCSVLVSRKAEARR